jgi:hypothetical protein
MIEYVLPYLAASHASRQSPLQEVQEVGGNTGMQEIERLETIT